MVKNRINNRGFTLVELIISIAILALIIVAISGVMFSNNNVFRKNKSDLDVQNTALDTLNVIENDVMQARHIMIKTTSGDYYICSSDKNLIEAGGIGSTSVPYTDSAGVTQAFQLSTLANYSGVVHNIEEISEKGSDAESEVYDSLDSTNRAILDTYYQKVKMMSGDDLADTDGELITYSRFFQKLFTYVPGSFSSFDDLTSPADLDVEKLLIVYPTYVSGSKQPCVVEYDFSTAGQIKMSNSTAGGAMDVYTEYVDSSGYTTITVNTDANTLTFNIDFDRNNRVYHGSRVVTIRNAHVLNDAD